MQGLHNNGVETEFRGFRMNFTSWEKQLRFSLLLASVALIQWGCTNRSFVPFEPQQQAIPAPQVVEAVADVQFQGQPTQALGMKIHSGSLYLIGRPFGFSRWNISADPENPVLTFAASDNIREFALPDLQNGPWVVDYYASRALAITGRYAVLSGDAGISVIDIGQTNQPKEVFRVPISTGLQATADPRFVYEALLPSPTSSLLYGFRQQDSIFYLSGSSGGRLNISSSVGYAPSNICCVTGAAAFNGLVYLSLQSRLGVMRPDSSGILSWEQVVDKLAAVNVVATSNFLYVQHEPGGNSFGLLPRGIYVFDRQGRNVAYMPLSPLEFAVNESDSHIYINQDDISITIYRMLWNQGSSSSFPF